MGAEGWPSRHPETKPHTPKARPMYEGACFKGRMLILYASLTEFPASLLRIVEEYKHTFLGKNRLVNGHGLGTSAMTKK